MEVCTLGKLSATKVCDSFRRNVAEICRITEFRIGEVSGSESHTQKRSLFLIARTAKVRVFFKDRASEIDGTFELCGTKVREVFKSNVPEDGFASENC